MGGCCAVSDSNSPDAAVWLSTCRGFWSAELCLKREDVHGNARCAWTSVPSEYDCALLETTESPPPPPSMGCCAANQKRDVNECARRSDVAACECETCFWVEGRNADCAWQTTTTTTTESPRDDYKPEPKGKESKDSKEKDGCCVVGDGYEFADDGELCTECMDEGECDGKRQCKWAPEDKCGYEEERMLFGGEGVETVNSVMEKEVSVWNVVLLLAAAIVVYGVYRWRMAAKRREFGYAKLNGDDVDVEAWNGQTVY